MVRYYCKTYGSFNMSYIYATCIIINTLTMKRSGSLFTLSLCALLFLFSISSVDAQTTVNCSVGSLLSTYCWTNNDQTIRDYQSSNGYPLRLTFNSGILGAFDFIILTDSLNGGGNEIVTLGNNTGYDLGGLTSAGFVSPTGMMSVVWDTDASNSCAIPSPDATITIYTLECLACQFPSANVSIDYSPCPSFPEIIVDVTDLGSFSDIDINLMVQ